MRDQGDEAEESGQSIRGRKIGKADQGHHDDRNGHDQPLGRPEPRQDLVEAAHGSLPVGAGEETRRQRRTAVLCLIAQSLGFSPQIDPDLLTNDMIALGISRFCDNAACPVTPT